MQFTLNQIKKKLNDIATDHAMINSFGYGEIDEINISGSGNTQYPLMYCVLQPCSISNKEILINYNLLFMDKIDPNTNNRDEVMSDLMLTALDVRAKLLDPINRDNFNISLNGNLTPFLENFSDVIAGWNMSITFRVLDFQDRCQIPSLF